MSWLLWRQHRQQGAVTAGLLLVLGVLLWVTGVNMAHTLHAALLACRPTDSCDELQLFQGDGALIGLVNATVLVPALVGMFWGATIVGRELDAGTNRLVWVQSVTRRRWLRDKIALLVLSSLAVGGALSGLVTWWSGTLNSYHHDRFQPLKFDLQGLSPVAYTLFASALGLAAGVLWRRTLPALATAAGGYFVVRLAVENFLRPHYLAVKVASVAPGFGRDGRPGDWVFSNTLTLHGQSLSGRVEVPAACVQGPGKPSPSCMFKLGYADVTRYQPGSRYWTFQWIEAGLFVALAAVLVAVAVVALRRQDA